MTGLIEELSLNAWPALHTDIYDGWILRFANGYTKRANSISPLYPSTIPLDQKIEHCKLKYGLLGQPAIYKLTSGSLPADIDAELEQRGYGKIDLTAVQTLDLDQYDPKESPDTFVEPGFSAAWYQGFFYCAETSDPVTRQTAQTMLAKITGKIICAAKIRDGAVVGCGFGVIERGYIGIFDIVVARHCRGNGYGEAVVHRILAEAKNAGAGSAYLQVVEGNAPAENLYRKLGFRTAYHYWYRIKK